MQLTSWNTTNNPNDQYDMNGASYYVQNAEDPWSFQTTDNNLLRFVVQPGDNWAGDSNPVERSEIAGVTSYAPGTEVKVAYNFQIEPGAANTADWMAVGQFHDASNNGGGPPFAVEMNGEKMCISVRYANADGSIAYKQIYNDPDDIVRGHTYAMSIDVKFDDSDKGFIVVTRDGVQIASYQGPVGDNDSVYWKEGIYRSAASESIAVDYSDLSITSSTTGKVPNQISLTGKLVNDTGKSATDNITSDGRVSLSGTTVANATVAIFDGTTQIGSVIADAKGAWSTTTALGDGKHSLSATSTDSFGQAVSAAMSGSINVVTSTAVALTSASLLRDTGASATDYVTNAGGITLGGTATAGDTVYVYNNGNQIGQVTTSSGNWSLYTTLAQGTDVVTVKSVDLAGNSATSNPLTVVVDKTPPAAPVITGLVTGRQTATTFATNNNVLGVHGTAEGNATVAIYNGSQLLATTTANAAGAWDVSSANLSLADGKYKLTAYATDLAGNNSKTVSATLTIDTVAPSLAMTGSTTTATKLTLSGIAEAGSTVTTMNNATGGLLSATANSKEAWSIANGPSTAVRQMTLAATDAAGNRTQTALQLGSTGADTLVAAGNDILYGGAGADTFVFTAGKDNGGTLVDFQAGQDHLQLAGYNSASATFKQVDATHWLASDGAHSDVIAVANGAKLTAADVKFV